MKKKFFAIYALIGALVASPIFTSCVDDEESASVTAIRDAKTAELKSIAALKKAEAQAQATLDAANAAYKAAQAEAAIAAAKLAEAEAALKETQNEEAAVALEVQKKEAEKELAAIQAEMERQELLTEKALLEAQANLLAAKKQLDQATKNYDAQEKAELQTLATKYANAVTDLLNAKKTLASMTATLAMYETGFADAQVALEETKAYYNNEIAYAQARIDVLKQYVNYTEDIEALEAEYVKAAMAYDLSYENYNVAYRAYSEANNAVDSEKLSELYRAITRDEFYYMSRYGYLYDAEEDNFYRNWDWYWFMRNNDVFTNVKFKNIGINYEHNGVSTILGKNYVYEYEMADYRQVELQASYYIDSYKSNLKSYEDALATAQTEYTAAVTATAAAKTAWDNAAEADKDAKKADYEAALSHELNLKNQIENYKSVIEDYKEVLADFNKGLNLLKNEATLGAALQAKVKAYNDAAKAEYDVVAEAWVALQDAQLAQEEAGAAFSAIDALLNNGSVNIANNIAYYEGYIEDCQNTIAEAEKLLSNYYSNNEQLSWEDIIAWQKARVAAQEAVVAAKEVAVADAKAALDAAMPAEEEETPAE